MIDGAAWFVILLQIFFVDLLLGADNAVVIALACARLPPREARPRGDARRRRRDRAAARHAPVRQRPSRRAAGQAGRRLDADRHRAQCARAEGEDPLPPSKARAPPAISARGARSSRSPTRR